MKDQRERPFAFYLALFVVGIGAQWLNTAIDLQRHNFREKDGQLKLMDGKDPYYICAKFRRENGESGTGLLLGKLNSQGNRDKRVQQIDEYLFRSLGHIPTRKQSIQEGDMPFESPKCPLKSGLLIFEN
jgi:hypothetical protein